MKSYEYKIENFEVRVVFSNDRDKILNPDAELCKYLTNQSEKGWEFVTFAKNESFLDGYKCTTHKYKLLFKR